MGGVTLASLQQEATFIATSALCNDPVGSLALACRETKLGSGITVPAVGRPTFGCNGMCADDGATSVLAGNPSGAEEQFFAGGGPIGLSDARGVSVEAVVCKEPGGAAYQLYFVPEAVEVQIRGADVVFKLTTVKLVKSYREEREEEVERSVKGPAATVSTFTASAVLKGQPQLLQCVFDRIAGVVTIWVDGVQVLSSALAGVRLRETTGLFETTGNTTSGSQVITNIPSTVVAGMLPTGKFRGRLLEGQAFPSNTSFFQVLSATSIEASKPAGSTTTGGWLKLPMSWLLLKPLEARKTFAVMEDLAVYEQALTASQIERHYAAFRQKQEAPQVTELFPQIQVFT